MRLTRRGLLVGAGVGGALLIAFPLIPRRHAVPLQAGKDEHVVDAFLKVGRAKGGKDCILTVAVPFCEMGQGITTLVAQIVADEAGADWRRVAVEAAPISPAYADAVLSARWAPLWMPAFASLGEDPGGTLARLHAERAPLMMTADGTALAAFEAPLREAGAALRAMMAQAAADRWNVGWEECIVRDGVVSHNRNHLSFAQLLDSAVDYDPPSVPVLRSEPPRERPGQFPESAPARRPRLDLPAKVDGSFTFAGDVRLPDMVFVAIAHGPQGASLLTSYDKQAAARVRGLVGVVRAKRWLAAAATTWHAADKAVRAMEPRFNADGPIADSEKVLVALDTALTKGNATRLWAEGDPDALLEKPELSARYDVEAAFHAPLETASATARLRHGKLELWLATQAPEQARRAAARAAGLSRHDVIVYPMHAGGSFDARLDTRIAAEVTTLAVTLAKPVQLTYSRWQESLASAPRTPVSAMLEGALSPDKTRALGWRARLALPATALESGARLLDGQGIRDALDLQDQADPMACEGAMPLYRIPEKAVDHVPVALPLPTARFRGQAHGYTAFFTESFVDELAHKAGKEPLSFRIGMLEGEPRLVACLSGVARLAQWGGGLDASGQGIACHQLTLTTTGKITRKGLIAVVATARQEAGVVRVERLSAYVDIGRIVNMDIARQQIEGGLMFGLAHAVGGSSGYAKGRPLAGRLSQLGLPLLADCPKVDIAFADSNEDPFDPGELGMVAVAPAIANALFSATGVRFRRLPLISEGL
ncbi:molybdopterin-dependent oxidoreductase [Novosphingobium sp. SL115]|uniref:xanthine dehydrogenase family protein molybdopterin-binding subunit n=1 Tax=Novosphingobium sp. SL115 TaxID=2995150 RepID=UPI002275CE12|nr:molybdopterin cofactor-binding domain-containing protein [Novosphingobium sp. SL115]MCY1670554.1 molybdopterin-dependent oxidoreductase [Novosphingobium sp. SL115]